MFLYFSNVIPDVPIGFSHLFGWFSPCFPMHQATAETLTISCCTCSAKPLAPSASRAERANLRSVAFQIPGISVRLELSNPRNFREFYTRWCPSSLAKLVNITPISLWFMADITIVNGVYKPTYNWGAPSCRDPWFLVGGWVGMMTWPQYDGKIKFMFQTTNQFFWWTILAISETLLLHEFGHQQIWEGTIAYHMVALCMAFCLGSITGKWQTVNIWVLYMTEASKGVSLFVTVPSLAPCVAQFLKTNVIPLYVSHCRSFCGGSCASRNSPYLTGDRYSIIYNILFLHGL